jgi:hypothetical protein
LKTLVIDRKKWYRGKGPASSALLTESKKMCCLGFLGRAEGLKPKDIRGITTPSDSDLPKELLTPSFKKLVEYHHSDLPFDNELCKKLTKLNDKEDISDKERESKLRPLFRKLKYKLKFIN